MVKLPKQEKWPSISLSWLFCTDVSQGGVGETGLNMVPYLGTFSSSSQEKPGEGRPGWSPTIMVVGAATCHLIGP